MAKIGVARFLHGVIVDVDHVVEHAHRGCNGALQFVVIDLHDVVNALEMLHEVDRPQIANRNLGVAGVERDLGAEIARVHNADMLLRGANIARVLERDPRVARLEEHGQHLAPQVIGAHRLEELDLAPRCLAFIGYISLFEILAELVVQIGAGTRREQRPITPFHDSPHEQVRDPVRGVHVVRSAPIIPGVLAQFEELLNVEVPSLKIGAHSSLALAALVHRHGGVVDHFEERHHPLALAIGAFDV